MDLTKRPKPGGRNRKSNEVHVANGTFRGDRHGSADAFKPGTPKPVMELGEAGKQLWQEVLANLPAAATATIDSYKLSLLCQSWELLQASIARWTADPKDNSARLSVNALMQTVDRLGSQFGLSPRDRTRMSRVGWGEEKSEDPFADFLKGRAG